MSKESVTIPEQGAQPLSGTKISKDICEKLKNEVSKMKEVHPDFVPGLAIVQVGDREDSNVYIRMKIKMAGDIGMKAEHIKLPKNITEAELLNEIKKLNESTAIHGIIVQMPLDSEHKIDGSIALNAVSPDKDVDGLNNLNAAKVSRGEFDCFIPCTPKGCLELIRRSGVQIEGSRSVVLGRSKIVGMPMAELLCWNHSTVTICHSKTKNIGEICREADILVVAIGRPEMVRGDWIKPGAVVIDCGITAIPDASKASGQRLVGDVCFAEAKKVAGFLTPVPGGVGPMTVIMLMSNTVEAAKKAFAAKSQVGRKSFKASVLPLQTRSVAQTSCYKPDSEFGGRNVASESRVVSLLSHEITEKPKEESELAQEQASVATAKAGNKDEVLAWF